MHQKEISFLQLFNACKRDCISSKSSSSSAIAPVASGTGRESVTAAGAFPNWPAVISHNT